ncbi:MAG TPA: pyridoxal phosphate-dependent aminotransferase [Kofleriaceae bacterium]|nr:pyridoxal phosphate-dependent aminotransferase [Kofleriaceae bacterium]
MATRLDGISGFGIDRVARAAADDPDILRLENLDTDLRPPAAAIEATRAAVDDDDANSYLPFTGKRSLREVIAGRVGAAAAQTYDADRNVVVTCGGTQAIYSALLAATEPGDEVLLTDPTYAGVSHRVRLAGAVPRFVPFRVEAGSWRLDLDALRAAVSPRTRAMVVIDPDMPSGALLDREAWSAIARICVERQLWLIYDAVFSEVVYDGRAAIHPASLPGMGERTLTIGSVSKAHRMIGWRIGWIVGPQAIMDRVVWTCTYVAVTPGGIAQAGAEAALRAPAEDVRAAVAEWQRRRDVVLEQLAGWPVVAPAGGWSLLIDTASFGVAPARASELLLAEARIAATPMTGWAGPVADRHLRFVYGNEPVERLRTIADRIRGSTLDQQRLGARAPGQP